MEEETSHRRSCSDAGSYGSAIRAVLGKSFDPSKKYIIAIQGSTSSGKTTLSSYLHDVLGSSYSCRPVLLHTDDYYKNKPLENLEDYQALQYDFDNPASLDWDALRESIMSYLGGERMSIASRYDFVTKERAQIAVPNPNANVIIVEGIFAHNLFNTMMLNVEELDPLCRNKVVSSHFVPNTFQSCFGDFSILKVFLTMDRELMKTTRIEVDLGRSKLTREESSTNFDRLVYPGTIAWFIPSAQDSHIVVHNGTRNVSGSAALFDEIAKFFNAGDLGRCFEKILSKLAEKVLEIKA